MFLEHSTASCVSFTYPHKSESNTHIFTHDYTCVQQNVLIIQDPVIKISSLKQCNSSSKPWASFISLKTYYLLKMYFYSVKVFVHTKRTKLIMTNISVMLILINAKCAHGKADSHSAATTKLHKP